MENFLPADADPTDARWDTLVPVPALPVPGQLQAPRNLIYAAVTRI